STLSRLCLFMPGTDPIRVDDDTVVLSQARPAARFGMQAAPGGSATPDRCDAPADDYLVIVKGLKPGGTLKVSTVNVGSGLGVHLSGAPAGRAVRLSNTRVVWASPGADGQFASPAAGDEEPDETDSLCGLTKSSTGDDGLVVLSLGAGGDFHLSWVPIGRLPRNPAGLSLVVDDSAVVIAGIAPPPVAPQALFAARPVVLCACTAN